VAGTWASTVFHPSNSAAREFEVNPLMSTFVATRGCVRYILYRGICHRRPIGHFLLDIISPKELKRRFNPRQALARLASTAYTIELICPSTFFMLVPLPRFFRRLIQ